MDISMVSRLHEILNFLAKLNAISFIVTRNEVEEQYDNLEELKDLLDDLDEALNKFNTIDLKEGNEIEEMLLELHRIFTTFEWHFSEINDLNKKILKQYKDKINNI